MLTTKCIKQFIVLTQYSRFLLWSHTSQIFTDKANNSLYGRVIVTCPFLRTYKTHLIWGYWKGMKSHLKVVWTNGGIVRKFWGHIGGKYRLVRILLGPAWKYFEACWSTSYNLNYLVNFKLKAQLNIALWLSKWNILHET